VKLSRGICVCVGAVVLTACGGTSTGAGGDEEPGGYSPEQVESALAAAGVAALRGPDVPDDDDPNSFVINPRDAPLPEASIFSDEPVQTFGVFVYRTEADAERIAAEIPGSSLRLREPEVLVRRNLVVVIERSASAELRERIDRALASLDG
jgi:hypothetical protein